MNSNPKREPKPTDRPTDRSQEAYNRHYEEQGKTQRIFSMGQQSLNLYCMGTNQNQKCPPAKRVESPASTTIILHRKTHTMLDTT